MYQHLSLTVVVEPDPDVVKDGRVPEELLPGAEGKVQLRLPQPPLASVGRLGQPVESLPAAESPGRLRPDLETSKVAPNSFFKISKERVRSDLKRLKNRLLKPVLKTFQAGPPTRSLLYLRNKLSDLSPT